MSPIKAVLIMGCVVVAACDHQESDADAAREGRNIVRNVSAKSDERELRETLRIGMIAANGPEQFSRIVAVRVANDGSIFVANGGSTSVREFDRDGRFVAEFGSRGSGPAELKSLDDLALAGDTVVLIDWQRMGKVALITRQGTYLDSWQLREGTGPTLLPVMSTRKGWLWTKIPATPPRIAGGDSVVINANFVLKGILRADSGVTLYSYPGTTLYGTGQAGGEGGLDWGLFRQPRVAGFDNDGRMYLPAKDQYEIEVWDGDSLTRRVRLDVPARKLSKKDINSVSAEAVAIVDTMTGLDAEYRRQERAGIKSRIERQRALPIPDVMGPIQRILVSGDGSFWVQRRNLATLAKDEAAGFYQHRSFPLNSTTWDLFDSTGKHRGTVKLPARFRAEGVVGETVVGVAADDADVEFVVRYGVK